MDPGIVRRLLIIEVDAGSAVGFIADHEVEGRRASLLGVVHHADGMVGRKHQLYVPCRQGAHKAVCQLAPIGCGWDGHIVGIDVFIGATHPGIRAHGKSADPGPLVVGRPLAQGLG